MPSVASDTIVSPGRFWRARGGGEGELLVAAALTGVFTEVDGGFAAEDDAGGRGHGQSAVVHFPAEADEHFGDFGSLTFDVCGEQDGVVAQLGGLGEGGVGGGAVVGDDERVAGGEDGVVRFGGVGDNAGKPGLQAVGYDRGQGVVQVVFFRRWRGRRPRCLRRGRWDRWR